MSVTLDQFRRLSARRVLDAASVGAWLRASAITERARWPLWLPVGVGAGVALYFSLHDEPWRWAPPILLCLALFVAFAARRRTMVCCIACGVATLSAGMGIAQWHAVGAAAPVLERTLRNVTVSGTVDAIAPGDEGGRITIDVDAISRMTAAQTPARVRVSTWRLPEGLRPGDAVQVRATLSPPPGPAMPGAYDFQRRAWFERLGGVGFATGAVVLVDGAESSFPGLRDAVGGVRTLVRERIERSLDGTARGLALAMIIGERGAVPDGVTQAMRDSGLAHLLAISGLHLGLAAGFVFLVVRGGLALIPAVALRYPIKKWAAAAAIAAAFGYLVLAGAPVPTQRAFVMTGLVLLAVMIDRVGISMRLVGWAALVVLLLQPASLVGASFQMSFAAVVALVATYEVVGGRLRPIVGQAGPLNRIAMYLFGVALTSLVAGLATAPFALFHFDRLALYGLAANMVAVPIAALWVMPLAVAALVLMPLGLAPVALVPMGWGLDAIAGVAETVAGWPGAVQFIPSLPVAGLLMVVAGGLWLAIWQRRWRFAGVVPVMGGLAMVGFANPPDIMITADGRLAGFRDAGVLYVSSVKTEPFARDVWRHRTGAVDWRGFDDEGSPASCDALGCLVTLRGYRVAFLTDPRAQAEDCRTADIVVASVPLQRNCRKPAIAIDRFDLWRHGAHALSLEVDGVTVRSVHESRGDRPWVPQRDRHDGGQRQ